MKKALLTLIAILSIAAYAQAQSTEIVLDSTDEAKTITTRDVLASFEFTANTIEAVKMQQKIVDGVVIKSEVTGFVKVRKGRTVTYQGAPVDEYLLWMTLAGISLDNIETATTTVEALQ